MDRSWMNQSRISPEYEEGVEQFLQFASKRGQPDEDGKYYCPCINCLNGRRQILDDIREHLLCDGIKRNYTTWIWHGEMTDMQSGQQSEPFDVEMGDRLEDMIRDLGQESFQQAHAPMYDTLQTDSKKPLYPGCKNSLTLLSAVLSLVNIKARYGWSDKSFSSLLQVVHDMLPEENTFPKSYYQAKKILCPMDINFKKTGDMTSEAAKEIADKIDALEEQASQGSFVTHGRHDILTAAIGRPEHPGRVRAVGAGITIKQYFGSASRTSSIAPEYLQQLTQQIKDQLEDSITEKVTRRLMLSLSQMQSQGLALPPEPDVGPSAARVSTKESCVDPSGNDLDTGDSYKCGLYIEEYPSRLVALGRVYEGSTTIHNIPLLHDQVKVSVEEIRDVDAPIPVPTKEVKVVGQALNTFLAWPTHLVKRLSEQGAVRPAKPADRPDDEVDDPLYLMTLTIPQLFLKPLQVMWDATLFGLFNENFPLYIKHEDLSEIAHGGQCLSISVIQLWILHMTETSMRAGNIDVYGFLEPQSIQRSGQSQFESENYIKNWMQNSKRDVYLGAYLNGAHWQMVVILPKENVVIWFCSLHNKPDNYLKGIINSALKGLDDTQQSKSKTPARWIVVKYFTDPRPLEPERLKALRNQWAKYYLKVKNET
ncbi:hypothetical protein HKD37_01G001313 [Glycine soja]